MRLYLENTRGQPGHGQGLLPSKCWGRTPDRAPRPRARDGHAGHDPDRHDPSHLPGTRVPRLARSGFTGTITFKGNLTPVTSRKAACAAVTGPRRDSEGPRGCSAASIPDSFVEQRRLSGRNVASKSAQRASQLLSGSVSGLRRSVTLMPRSGSATSERTGSIHGRCRELHPKRSRVRPVSSSAP